MNRRLPAVFALALGLSLSACGASDEKASEAKPPKTMTVSGTLLLDGQYWGTEKGCDIREGYEDLDGGGQVTVYGADGSMVAVGSTDTGTVSPTDRGACLFTFSLDDVPAEDNVYSIEIGHRGKMSFNKADSESLSFSLGS